MKPSPDAHTQIHFFGSNSFFATRQDIREGLLFIAVYTFRASRNTNAEATGIGQDDDTRHMFDVYVPIATPRFESRNRSRDLIKVQTPS